MTMIDHPEPVLADPSPHLHEDPPNPTADTHPREEIAPRIPAPAGEPSSAAWDVFTDWADAYLTGDEDDYELIRLHTWLVRFADELQTLASEGRRTPVRTLRARGIPFREIGLAVRLDDKMIRNLNRPSTDDSKDQAE